MAFDLDEQELEYTRKVNGTYEKTKSEEEAIKWFEKDLETDIGNYNEYNDYSQKRIERDKIILRILKSNKEIQEALRNHIKVLNSKEKEHKTRIRNLESKIIQQKEQISGLRGKYHIDAWLLEDYISIDEIKECLASVEKVYEREMKPYQTEYGLDVTYLNKKEKAELINTRNCLIVQMETYKRLLEGRKNVSKKRLHR